MLSKLLIALSILACAVLANDGYTIGRWNFRSIDIGSKLNPLDVLSPFHIRVTFPTTCATQCGEFRTGGMPVMLFATGFAGSLDASNYDVVLSGIARHGVIVVAVDREPGFALTLDFAKLGVQLQKVVGWIRNTSPEVGLLRELTANGFIHEIRDGGAKLIYAGHSTGVHLVLRYVRDLAVANEVCPDVGAVVMLSPLDGQDPYGIGGDNLLIHGQKLPFSVPGLIVAASLDPVSGTLLEGVACAPDNRANRVFYESWVGAINFMTVKGVGHLDVLNEAAKTSFDDTCARSNLTDVTLRQNYRTVVRGAVVNFIQGVILNSKDYYDDVDNIPHNSVDMEFERQGMARAFSCTAVPVVKGMSFELQTGLILFGLLFSLTFITGLYCFFRKMDDDTLHRYHPAEGLGYDQPASFQTKLEPQYPSASVANEYASPQNSMQFQQSSRAPSINV